MKVELLNYMGDDLSVVDAARVSFNKVSEWDYIGVDDGDYLVEILKEQDKGLINYLAKHNHWTPFAHTSVSFRVKAPVPIRTQCFKHKQGLVENEESRRYISSRPELYIPDEFREKPAGSIKQGSGGTHPESMKWQDIYVSQCENAIDTYMSMIEDEVCPEQARFILPQGCQVNWIWTGNLYAFANFYNKRTDPTAQKEVAYVAEQVGKHMQELFPVSWEALTK